MKKSVLFKILAILFLMMTTYHTIEMVRLTVISVIYITDSYLKNTALHAIVLMASALVFRHLEELYFFHKDEESKSEKSKEHST